MGGSARRLRVWVLGGALVALIVVLFYPQAFSLRLAPSPENTWLLFFLSTMCFLAIVVLTFVLARQVVKLFAERRAQVLGSRFKTKLVIGALALSLTPVICMFGFTYGLINRTLDKWFSQPVVTVRDDNQSMLALLTQFVTDNAQNEADSIAASRNVAAGLQFTDAATLQTALARHRTTLQGGFAVIYDGRGRIFASYNLPPGLHPNPMEVGRQELTGGTYMLTESPLSNGGRVQVGMPIPSALTTQIANLAQARDRYARLALDRRSLRLVYIGYLLLLTMAILFGATWLSLRLSKAVTVPIAELAAATQEISKGNLAYRVRIGAQDEVGALVESFNQMVGELETSRRQIDASRQQLQSANQELDARQRYTAALLENTPSAVISLDRDFRVEQVNPAVQRLFGLPMAKPRQLEEIFDASSRREVLHLLRKSERWPQATGQLEVAAGGRQLTLAATIAALPASDTGLGGRRRFAGYVLVLEDLTDLLRIQKTAAWREVAQRIAHEIKNPLTPIALSAQRIRRRLASAGSGGPLDVAVINDCAAMIEAEVHSMQRLVDEFGAFARFPHAQPLACDLNEIIESALRSFDGRLDGIDVRTRLDPLPALQLDPNDMRRVFVNLIDNAAEAMHGSPFRRITLATQHLEGVVEAVVADTGHGVPEGDKERLFLPYYSTKERGSGLGLAIVLRIIEENGGTLRVEDNTPVGARFIVELPLEATGPEAGA